jgi:hypothetical protein
VSLANYKMGGIARILQFAGDTILSVHSGSARK